ncbi:MAG: mobile mystery protein B, partial [Candidatus Margulisiibacteriota bacterium]
RNLLLSKHRAEAVKKYLAGRRKILFDITWLKRLHKEMFNETWKWAGIFRQRNFNIGADWPVVPEHLKTLIDDIAYWKKEPVNLSIFEQSIRIHHRIVKIHPFINGNGRHARLASDIFLYSNDHKLPTWPDNDLIEKSDIRVKYIEALKEADKGYYKPLEEFTADLID